MSHNESQGYGGGVWVYEDPQAGRVRVDIAGSTLFDNYAAAGGGIYSSNSSLTLADSRAIDNDSDGYGGGVSTAGSTIAINSSRIRNNDAGAAGGGVYSYDSSLTLAATRVSGNDSDGYGALSTPPAPGSRSPTARSPITRPALRAAASPITAR